MNTTSDAPATGARIWRVGELTRQIKDSLEGRFGGLWAEGEISNFTRAASGHLYFTLKDEEAQIRAVMFRGSADRLRFDPANGTKVHALGDVTVYPPRGEYQLKIVRMEPAGIGALQLAFEQLKKRLEQEGLFDAARKRPIPFLPRRVGVVTSPTGAAIRDILKVLRRRFPGISVTLCPCKVQGEGAAAEVAASIALANERGEFDVLIVGRGGGSLEDLWAFNEEVVARAIAASMVPVISAVGHEIDFTIADFVADLRAPTPSAAAELAVPDREELVRRIDELDGRLRHGVGRRFAWLGERLDALTKRSLFRRPRELIELHAMRLDELLGRLKRPLEMARRLESRLAELTRRLAVAAASGMRGREATFLAAMNRLEPVSPLNTMRRGYSIVTRLDDPRPLTDASGILPGERVQVRMARGAIACEVTDVIRDVPPRGEQGTLPLE